LKRNVYGYSAEIVRVAGAKSSCPGTATSLKDLGREDCASATQNNISDRGSHWKLTWLLLIGCLSSQSLAGGLSPEEARQRMTLPPGFTAQVFASEPEIRQPVAACFDERGRMWVIEYLQYPVPAGLKPVTVDQYLRTEYDRTPEPPPRGPRGADRIKILEDTDGDGKADKVTTFLEGLNLASGLAVGHGGVFVGQAPYLLFYPDKNRDDKPDGDPEVLLSGFGLQDAHATVNSMGFGPDGWLYGAQGSTVTAKIRGIEFQQGIWRYHPQAKKFELFAEGGGNTWGLDFDRQGNAFGSSNGAFITFHMVQGGNYWKGFAKHGPLHNPYTYGYFDSIAYDGPKRGGHVTPGGIIYKGDSFPPEYRGAFIGGNLLSNAVYWHKLSRRGSTFSGEHAGALIDSHDAWFRPIDLLTGPDGSVFVVDWYDKRASHLDPRDNWDKTNGRIYTISYEGTKRVERFDLARLSSHELVALRTRQNDWWPDMARRILAERRDPSVYEILRSYLKQDDDETTALRDLWALYASGGLDDATARANLDHRIAGVRRWTARLLGDAARLPEGFLDRLVEMAAHDGDVGVRSQLASSCQRWTPADSGRILRASVGRSEDAKDPFVPLQIWWALEPLLRGAELESVLESFGSSPAQALPVVRDHLLERIARRLASRGEDRDYRACARLLSNAPGGEQVARLVAGMEKGLEGRRLPNVPSELVGALDRLWRDGNPSVTLIRLGVRLGSAPALAQAVKIIGDSKAADAERVALIELAGQTGQPQCLNSLEAAFQSERQPAVRLSALNALGGFATQSVATLLLSEYPKLSDSLRDRVRDVLCGRPAWTTALLDAMESGKIATKDLRPAQVSQIVQLKNPALSARVERLWGRIPGPNSEAKRQRIAEVRGILPEGDKGNPDRGRTVYKAQCAGCHRLFGEGEAIGPELTGSERGNLDFLLTSLVDPSALIRKEYQAQTIAIKDGRVLTGLVIDENDKTLTLVDSKQQKLTIARAEIEERKSSDSSLMPEGVLDKLADNEIRDLFRYLQSSGPAAR
jgi:putative membrane-bound dehydrogenase-like protein